MCLAELMAASLAQLNLYGTFSVASKCAAVSRAIVAPTILKAIARALPESLCWQVMFKNSDKRDVDAEKGVIIMVASVACV